MSPLILSILFAFLISIATSQDRIPPRALCFSPYCADQNLQKVVNVTLVPEQRFQPCDPDDIGNYFTPCDPSTKKKHLMQYYKAPAMCDSNAGLKLHAPIQVDCTFAACPRGEYLSVDSSQCSKCPKGQFHEGPVFYFANATQWPAETVIREFNVNNSVQTMTEVEQNQVTHTILSLVHNEVNNVNATSYTEISFRILLSNMPVRLKFDFRVFGGEQEQQFGNTFYRWIMRNTGEIYVRGTKEGQTSNTLLHESVVNNENDWESREVEFQESGVYEISFRFSRQFTRADIMNGMQVRDLRLEGYTDHTTSCLKCPPGSYSDSEGQHICKVCPKNTFAANEGAESCEPCPPGQHSYEGSASCTAESIACTGEDFFAVEVENSCFVAATGERNPAGQRRVKYQWIEPRVCFDNVTNAATLPAEETLPCSQTEVLQCPDKSQYLQIEEKNALCSHCSEGKVPSSTKSHLCETCPDNSFPVNQTLVISNFLTQIDQLEDYSTGCKPESQCQSKGFRKSVNSLDSGVGNGRATSHFSFSVDSRHFFAASVMLNFTLHCKKGMGRASFYSDGALVHVAECASCTPDKISSLEIALRPAHKAQMRVEFTSVESVYSTDCNMLKVHSIALKNVGRGGFSACQFCIEGSELKTVESEPTCVKCEPGHAAEKGKDCAKCPAGTYSQNYGSVNCLKCPNGMTSEEGAVACKFVSNPMEYILPAAEGEEALAGEAMTRYNWTSILKGTLNAARFAVIPPTPENQEAVNEERELAKKIIFSLPDGTTPIRDPESPYENENAEHEGSMRYPQIVCPPHSLACLEMKINGVEEVFSLAEVATMVDAKEPRVRSTSALDEATNSNSIQTMRLYQERNRFCGGNTSVVDLNFVCAHYRTPLVQAKQTGNCTFTVDVRSIESCHVCKPDEFQMVKDVHCKDNKHLKEWRMRSGVQCNPVSKPDNDWEWCVKESILYLAWVIPCIAFVVVCCVSTGCCVGTVTLLRRVRKLKTENEKLSLLKHQHTHLELKDNNGLDEGVIASTP